MTADDGSNRKTRPSMQDVAERAGVSKTTVSHVLSDAADARVADTTRQRVIAVADELGYRRDLLASGLRRSRTDTIGLISDRITTSPWGWAMILGAQDAAWGRGRMLLTTTTADDAAHEREALEGLLDRRVDGLVLGATYHRQIQVSALSAMLPVVLLNAFDASHTYAAVVPDDERGGYDATTLLLEHGHRRIGFIDSLDPIPASTLRERGYRRALEAHGIAVDPAWTVKADETITPDAGRRATEQLMARGLELTALFCFNDRVASGAYRTLRRLGFEVPRDVSVVGFDDQADLAAGLDPPLTTIALPYETMGRWAVDRLLDQIDAVPGADQPKLHREYCPPVIRASIAPP